MLIDQLTGGLGNQMFQYAAGRALALRLGAELYLDITHFEDTPMGKKNIRQYELSHFNILEKFKKPRFHFIKKFLKVNSVYSDFTTFREQHVEVHPEFFRLGDNTYIEGCWQSEQYFKDAEEVIRQEFTFKTPATGRNRELLEKIDSVSSVSLHVRRGDYVTNPDTNQVHGVCGMDYYQRAVNYIAGKVDNPHFFMFSDEPEWVQENLELNFPFTVINHNKGANSFEDMRLMSACRHNIIANSSFSWWGAWLNANPEKIIIAPSEWYADKQHNTKDIVPDGWIKL